MNKIYSLTNQNKFKFTVYERFKGIATNTGIQIRDRHEQECCENVYADWSSLKDTDFFDREFTELNIYCVENVGFSINGYLVNCYNEQNGYYSSELELIIDIKGNDKAIDVSNCVKNEIY